MVITYEIPEGLFERPMLAIVKLHPTRIRAHQITAVKNPRKDGWIDGNIGPMLAFLPDKCCKEEITLLEKFVTLTCCINLQERRSSERILFLFNTTQTSHMVLYRPVESSDMYSAEIKEMDAYW